MNIYDVQIKLFVKNLGFLIYLGCLLRDLDSGSSQAGRHTHTELSKEQLRSLQGTLRSLSLGYLISGLSNFASLRHLDFLTEAILRLPDRATFTQGEGDSEVELDH